MSASSAGPRAILARIAGTGSYLPGEPISNARVASRVGREVLWVGEMLGARTRHAAIDPDTGILRPGESNASMAVAACRSALENAGLPVRAVDLLILATSTPDYPFPGTALFVQEKLGLEECQVLELRAGCGGMAQAFVIAEQLIGAGRATTALVVGSELITPFSRLLDPGREKGDLVATAMFGDGAGAVVMTAAAGDDRGILACMCRSIGGARPPGMLLKTGGAAAPTIPRDADARGSFVHDFQAIVKHGPELVERAAEWIWKSQIVERSEIRWYVPPQVSGYLIGSIGNRTDLEGARVFSNFAEVGNTASASIYIALDQMNRGGELRRGDVVALLPAEATKWSYGAILVRW